MDDAEFTDRCQVAWESLPDEISSHIDLADAWAINLPTRVEWMRREISRRFRLYKILGEGVDPLTDRRLKDGEIEEKREVFDRACAADPVFFMDNCIWTIDPENTLGCGTEQLPLKVFKYARELWIEPWLEGAVSQKKCRRTHDKSRRMIMSIYRMALETWCLRYLPGSKSWVSTDKETKLDRGLDWNSLLGKFRHMWMALVRFMPWNFPDLPPHSDVNQTNLLRFPEWRSGKKALCEEVWANELIGVLPSDPRGGAAGRGFVDEAAWVQMLKDLLDAAESMTRDLSLASSAPSDTTNLYWLRREQPGVIHNAAPWWMYPPNIERLRLSDADDGSRYAGEFRGEHTKKWRSARYDEEANNVSSQELARNWDIDPRATAGAKIFLNWDPDRVCGQQDENDPTWDLFDPDLELQVWMDPGRGDPWALWWVQIDHRNGDLNVVDYDMGNDKTIHYWVPMLKGWPWASKDRWRTAPEATEWHKAVPWSYDEDRIERIKRWNSRRHLRGGVVKMIWSDFYGTQHYGNDLFSVQERFHEYGLYCESVPSNYKVESFLEKADELLLRTRISGFLVGFRPEGKWPSPDEAFTYWRRRERGTSGRPGKPADPIHDDYSHPGMAFVYGGSQLQMLWAGRVRRPGGPGEPDEPDENPGISYGGKWW